MNSKEIKQQYSMKDIVEQYGFKVNRAGFINCPFHKENTASMKIYKDSYHCFGCGESGDIFSFIGGMDNLTFKEVFLMLGGTYEKPTFSSNLAIYHAQKKKEERARMAEKLRKRKELNNVLIDVYRDYAKRSEPFSEVWCDCMNALIYQLYLHEILNEKGGRM